VNSVSKHQADSRSIVILLLTLLGSFARMRGSATATSGAKARVFITLFRHA
jgi:hypothetical protein